MGEEASTVELMARFYIEHLKWDRAKPVGTNAQYVLAQQSVPASKEKRFGENSKMARYCSKPERFARPTHALSEFSRQLFHAAPQNDNILFE